MGRKSFVERWRIDHKESKKEEDIVNSIIRQSSKAGTRCYIVTWDLTGSTNDSRKSLMRNVQELGAKRITESCYRLKSYRDAQCLIALLKYYNASKTSFHVAFPARK